MSAKRCPACNGEGLFVPAYPACRLPCLSNKRGGWTCVERCDACDRYPNDLCAAAVVFNEVKWVQCANGGWHAVGRSRPNYKARPVGDCPC